jgi:hypothetical protein
MIALMYATMLAFDFAVLAGTAYLIERGWSAWWMLLALLIVAGIQFNVRK